MKFSPTTLCEVIIVEPVTHGDDRGFFREIFHASRFEVAGITRNFVQDNYTRTRKGGLRGLHFQHPVSQGKLVQALHGAIWDVAVDIRSDSPTFKQWVGVELTEANGRQLWIPPGFAHGFCVLSDHADVLYKCTDYYSPKTEHCIAWNDPELGVAWPVVEPMLSEKDKIAKPLAGQTVLPTVAEP